MRWVFAVLAMAGFLQVATVGSAGTIKGKVVIPKARTLADVVVYVAEAPGKFTPPKQHAVMDQKDLAFDPHVLPVLVGTTVDFLNSDQVLHNVFTPDKCAKRFNLGTWPRGQTRSFTFDQVDCAPVVLCNVHPEMEGFIVVLQNPYFAVTDKSGLFSISNVPEGKYVLKAWNRKFLDVSQQITVPKEGDVSTTLTLK